MNNEFNNFLTEMDSVLNEDSQKNVKEEKIETIEEQVKENYKDLLDKFTENFVVNMKKKYNSIFEIHKTDHPKLKLVKTACEQRLNVLLVGEAGVGKNHLSEQIATDLGLEFYPHQKISAEHKISGYKDGAGIYHETSFYKAFKDGGVFFLDEMDASDGEALIELNAALANRYYDFPNGRVNAHQDFICIAGANTYGTGASETYSGRNRLDGATLDRFIVIEMDYNTAYEISLGLNSKNVDLNLLFVNFIRTLRKVAHSMYSEGLIFSTRMIQNGVKLLDSGVDINDVIDVVVKKGIEDSLLSQIAYQMESYYFGNEEMLITTHKYGILWLLAPFFNRLFNQSTQIVDFDKYLKKLNKSNLNYANAYEKGSFTTSTVLTQKK